MDNCDIGIFTPFATNPSKIELNYRLPITILSHL